MSESQGDPDILATALQEACAVERELRDALEFIRRINLGAESSRARIASVFTRSPPGGSKAPDGAIRRLIEA